MKVLLIVKLLRQYVTVRLAETLVTAWQPFGSTGAGLIWYVGSLLWFCCFPRFTSEHKNDSSLEQVVASSDDTAAACNDCSDVPQHTPHATSQNKVISPSPHFRFFLY